jgi:hypothetical protein
VFDGHAPVQSGLPAVDLEAVQLGWLVEISPVTMKAMSEDTLLALVRILSKHIVNGTVGEAG